MDSSENEITVSREIMDAAASFGAREGRTDRQQLEHWLRVGKAVSELTPSVRQRIDRALSGEQNPEHLDGAEALIFNLEVEAGIAERLSQVDYASRRSLRGLSSVALDDEGKLVEYLPDGSTRYLGPS